MVLLKWHLYSWMSACLSVLTVFYLSHERGETCIYCSVSGIRENCLRLGLFCAWLSLPWGAGVALVYNLMRSAMFLRSLCTILLSVILFLETGATSSFCRHMKCAQQSNIRLVKHIRTCWLWILLSCFVNAWQCRYMLSALSVMWYCLEQGQWYKNVCEYAAWIAMCHLRYT